MKLPALAHPAARPDARAPHAPLQHSLQLSTLPLSRRSELIHTISAADALMGNDHIVSLHTGDGVGQRRAPALGQRICVSG